MGMTMIEKILARASGARPRRTRATPSCAEVDMNVLIDLQFATLWADPMKIADPDRTRRSIMDHAVPAPSIADADGGRHVRARSPRSSASSGSSTSAGTASATR